MAVSARLASTACVAPRADRVLELVVAAVDGDDLRRAREPRGGDHLQADAATADHAHALADPHPGRVAHGAEAGHDATAQQRGLPERDLVRDLDRATGRDDGVLGEARDPEPVLEDGAVGGAQPGAPVEQRAGERPRAGDLAERPPAGAAGAALSACGHEAEHDMVPDDEARDVLADGLDDARPLVAEDDRPAAVAQRPVGEVDVGMADACRGDTDQHLAAPGRIERHLLDRDRQPRFAHHARPHL